MKNNKKLLYIEWLDACANPNWFQEHQAVHWHDDYSKYIVREVGWLIKEDKRGITLAMRQNEQEHDDLRWGNLQFIPKTWIRVRKEIKPIKTNE